MSIPTYLLFILITAQFAHGYTVVLPSGKRIEGTLIDDQHGTVLIKDSKGVLISFRKDNLDLETMSRINAKPPSSEITNLPPQRKVPPSIVEIAAETRRQRTGKAKNLSLDEINDQKSSVSILGSGVQELQSSENRKAAIPEKEWQSRLWGLKKEVNRLREKVLTAQSLCEKAKQKQYSARTTPSRKPVGLMSTYKESPECLKMDEIETQLREAEIRLENAREEARRSGVSWSTLE